MNGFHKPKPKKFLSWWGNFFIYVFIYIQTDSEGLENPLDIEQV